MAELPPAAVGDEVLSPGRTVTEADIITWAGLVHDFTTLHVDAEMMRNSIFGRPIAHGYIALNLAIGLMFPTLAQWYAPDRADLSTGWTDVRFRAPVHAGDTLRCRRVVLEPDESGARHQVEMINQDGLVVLSGVETFALPR